MKEALVVIMIVFSAILFSFGLWKFISYIKSFPDRQTIKLAKQSQYLGKKAPTSFEDIAEKVALPFVKYIKMDALAKQEVAIALDAADSKDTPEMHLAKSIVIAGLSIVIGIMFLLISPIVGIALMVAGCAYAIVRYRKVISALKQMRREVEREVPRFATTIAEGLKTERDVLKLLIGYKVVAGPVFGKELDRTIADMKSSNYESALLRFDYRINSPYLSDVIKGLLGAIRGDDQTSYFNILCINLKAFEKAMLMEKANKRPAKINRLSLCMLLSLIILYVVVLGTVIIDSMAIFNF